MVEAEEFSSPVGQNESYESSSMTGDSRSQSIDQLLSTATAFFRSLEALRSLNAAIEGVTSTEFRALARVVDFGNTTPKKLASSMGLSTGTITAVTDRLVAKALLERVANEADRRSVLLTPTQDAKDMLARVYARYRQLWVDTLESTPTPDVDALLKLLGSVTARFESAALAPDNSVAGESASVPILGGPAE